jgi:signal transduction histidine kinase
MASSTGVAADPMPMPAPGAPVDDGGRGERSVLPRPIESGGGSGGRRASLTSPANWRVRTKLIAILLIPVVAIIVNALISASSVLTSTRDINRVSNLITVDRAALQLTQALEQERTYMSMQVATTAYSGSTNDSGALLTARFAATDSAYTALTNATGGRAGSFAAQVNDAITSVGQRMSNMSAKRQVIVKFRNPVSVLQSYNAIIQPLVDLIGLIPQGNDDRSLNSSVQAAYHLASANELLAQQQTQVAVDITAAEANQMFTSDESRAVLSLDAERGTEIDQFTANATDAEIADYNTKLDPRTHLDVADLAKFTSDVNNTPINTLLPVDAGATLQTTKWLESSSATMAAGDQVISDLLDQINNRVGSLRGSIQRSALFSALFTVLILAAALIITLVVAQSLVRPLFALRTAALDIAERRLPDAVRRLRESSEQVIDDEVETVGIDTDEEIGEVARAFDQVHREAVRLASEQAVLRNNVNAMFVNLSRRSQGLVERQLRLIDDLENREQDPDQLSNLFKLDHLATRMRRNNESLLVLAGTDTARRWTHPVPLNEVVLAAISEVEQYTRIKQTTAAPVSIAGNGVSDVVHLIAELLENATSYSPPATDVVVTSHSLGPGAGAMIEIVDQGIGMPAKELERVNERLASPPVVDVSVSRTMGLFAVGRLASRHGIRVQLRESPSRGITAVVRLPAKLVTGDGAGGTGPGAARGAAAAVRPGTDGASRPQGVAAAFGAPAALAGGGRPELGKGASGPATGPTRQPAAAAFGRGADDGRGAPRSFREDPEEADETTRFNPQTGPAPIADAGRFGAPPLAIGPGSRDSEPRTGGLAVPDRRYTEDDTQYFGRESFTGGQPAAGQGRRGGYEPEYDEPSFDEASARSMTGPLDVRDPRADWSGDRPSGPDPREFTGPMARPGVGAGGHNGNGSGAFHQGGFTPAHTGPQDSVFARPADRPEPVVATDAPRPYWEPEHTGPITGGYPVRSAEDSGPYYVGEGEDVDTTPIFDSVSAWFQRRSPSTGEMAVHAVPPEPVVEATPPNAYMAPRPAAGMPAYSQSGGFTNSQSGGFPAGQAGGFTTGQAGGYADYQTPRPAEPVRARQADLGPGGYRQPTPSYADGPSSPRIPVTPSEQPLPTRGGSQAGGGQAGGGQAGGGQAGGWESPGDAGWRAAEALRQPGGGDDSSVTKAGLPVRVPKQHLVPGTAEPASNRKPPERQADAATRSPEAVGGRLASFYQGVRQGRNMGAEMRSARRDGQEDR